MAVSSSDHIALLVRLLSTISAKKNDQFHYVCARSSNASVGTLVIGIPVVVERKHLPPHDAIIQDARRGFPFIVSVRPESSETGIVGLFCTYTKITEMCDIRNVINQVHMYVFTDV